MSLSCTVLGPRCLPFVCVCVVFSLGTSLSARSHVAVQVPSGIRPLLLHKTAVFCITVVMSFSIRAKKRTPISSTSVVPV